MEGSTEQGLHEGWMNFHLLSQFHFIQRFSEAQLMILAQEIQPPPQMNLVSEDPSDQVLSDFVVQTAPTIMTNECESNIVQESSTPTIAPSAQESSTTPTNMQSSAQIIGIVDNKPSRPSCPDDSTTAMGMNGTAVHIKTEPPVETRTIPKEGIPDGQYIEVIDVASTSGSESSVSENLRNKNRNQDEVSILSCKSNNSSIQRKIAYPEEPNSSSADLTPLRVLAVKLLESNEEIEFPSPPSLENFSNEAVDYTVKKIVWWILRNTTEPSLNSVVHPELHDVECSFSQNENRADYDAVDAIRACDSDEEADRRSTNKKTAASRQYMREFFGANTLVWCGVRNPCKSYKEDAFMKLFDVQPGANFDNDSFLGKCLVCNENVSGKRELETHLNSFVHKQNMRKLSLDLGQSQYSEHFDTEPEKTSYKARLKVYTGNEESGASVKLITETPNNAVTAKKFLTNVRLEDYSISEDHAQNNAKLQLKYTNKWTKKLDQKWKNMKDQETKLIQEFKSEQKNYLKNPPSHPDHQKEWLIFWNRRKAELSKLGKNPEEHDFKTEWGEFWIKRMMEILKSNKEKKILDMKTSMGLDAEKLKELIKSPYNPPAHDISGIPGAIRPRVSHHPGNSYRRQQNSHRAARQSPYGPPRPQIADPYRYPQFPLRDQNPVNYNFFPPQNPNTSFNFYTQNSNGPHGYGMGFYNPRQNFFEDDY